jgi:hypothetical protein
MSMFCRTEIPSSHYSNCSGWFWHRAQGEPFLEPVFSSEIQSRSIHGHEGEEFVVHKVGEEFVVHNSVLVEHNSDCSAALTASALNI